MVLAMVPPLMALALAFDSDDAGLAAEWPWLLNLLLLLLKLLFGMLAFQLGRKGEAKR